MRTVTPRALARLAARNILLLALLGCSHGKPLDSIELRVAMLETQLAKRTEALDFLQKVYDQQKASAEAEEAREPAPDAVFAVDIAANVRLGMVDGPNAAPVTIVEAFDFACPYCSRSTGVLEELVKQYDGKLRVVFKNMVVHSDTAMTGHLASCGAAKQNQYVAFNHAFWADAFGPYAASGGKDAAALGIDSIRKIAGKLGLDTRKLEADMAGPECQATIDADMAELAKFQVNATPTFFVNGTYVSGGLSKPAFEELIDGKLKVVAASGVRPADYYQNVVMKGETKFRSKKDSKP